METKKSKNQKNAVKKAPVNTKDFKKQPTAGKNLLTKNEIRIISVFFAFAYAALIIIFSFYLIIVSVGLGKSLLGQKAFFVYKPKETGTLQKFLSCSQLQEKLSESQYGYRGVLYKMDEMLAIPETAFDAGAHASGAADFSQTNIQVAGVDEADIVKTDGRYIYALSGNFINIVSAYPPEQARLLSSIAIDGRPLEIFIDNENIIVFGFRETNDYLYKVSNLTDRSIQEIALPYYSNITFAEIYSLSNPEQPILKRKLELEGDYLSSRKIGDYVYFILNSYPRYYLLRTERSEQNSDSGLLPLYRDVRGSALETEDQAFGELVKCSDISYFNPMESGQYLTVVGLPTNNHNQEITKKVILGASQNIYTSVENLYLASIEYEENKETDSDFWPPYFGQQNTRIFKFSLDRNRIELIAENTVPGRALNQFSMDEHKNYFRIATTIGNVARGGGESSNNVYVLDNNLAIVGYIEDIAPGEQIYSARFMGDKGYLVTFKKVDPFFTLDLADPFAPKILGELKITGYSDYLHPYDENHIIGIGKETVEAAEGDFAWYQGIKMAIFDVSDFSNPKELGKTVIGDRGTDSPILSDHKALLFSKEKNLLAIPITLAELGPQIKIDANRRGSEYGEYVFQGTYVFDINPVSGFQLRGRITHYNDQEPFIKSGYRFYGGNLSIKRNLYINEYLYSISKGIIKVNSLDDLSEINSIELKTAP